MPLLVPARAAVLLLLLTPPSRAQNQYTVWASVIFSRTGDRTPDLLGLLPTTLTSLGAQQAYSAGSFFRARYLSSVAPLGGAEQAPLHGLGANTIDPHQLYVQALDEQFAVASAQAFTQGFYPPFMLNDTQSAGFLDPTSITNGSYLASPLGGYEYAQIHTSGGLDPSFVYLGGSLDCPAFDLSGVQYAGTPDFASTEAASRSIYQAVGPALLSDVLPEEAWDYYNAYAIYDYLAYQATHNATAAAILNQTQLTDSGTNTSYLSNLRWLADSQQYAELGNLNAINNITSSAALQSRISYSISTIAGNLLAAKMLAQLQIAIQTGGEYYKLSLLFGDYQPLTSFFALAGLPQWNSDFYGTSAYASSIAFELFSYTNNTMDMSFPSQDELWVRFYFRNGSDSDADFRAYPILNRGPSETDLPWSDFEDAMSGISLGNVSDWCDQCGAGNIFCAAFNTTDLSNPGGSLGGDAAASSGSHRGVRPAVAGVLGAVIALVLAALLFALAACFAGMRVYRDKSHKSDVGGFKGGQKMASDPDLKIPKGGVVVGASVERARPMSPVVGGHERVGSWELAQAKEAGLARLGAGEGGTRLSFDEEEDKYPFRDPVKADERV